jgi:hypothetical protein
VSRRVLVCGGRDYRDAERVAHELNALHAQFGIAHLIHGAAPGADWLAKRWAEAHSIPVTGYPARWDLDGKAAGPIRNARMLREGRPDLVLAFPGGRGTDDMVRRALAANVTVVQIPPSPSRAGATQG